MKNLIIHNISKAYTPLSDFAEFREYKNCTIVVKDGLISQITDSILDLESYPEDFFPRFDACGGVAIPGFVDSHAHPVFAARRDEEFEMRNLGLSYQEIAAKGGGIRNSVRKLRALSEEDLLQRGLAEIEPFLANGTTTLEAKSGYGLSLTDELKILRVIKKLNQIQDLELIPTFLGAHEIPDEYRDNRRGYIELIINEMLPAVAKEGLAKGCDIFIEKNVYTIDEGREILTKAKELGFDIKIHADQLSYTGGCELAAELGAVSAEHFEYASDEGIKQMINKGVIFNLLPGAAYFIGSKDYPPARKIINAGGICALSTDFNPGTCYTTSLPLIMNIGAIYMKMSAKELLWSATRGGAMALKMDDLVGALEVGKQADLLLMNIDNLQQIPYSLGKNLVHTTIKKGRIITSKYE